MASPVRSTMMPSFDAVAMRRRATLLQMKGWPRTHRASSTIPSTPGGSRTCARVQRTRPELTFDRHCGVVTWQVVSRSAAIVMLSRQRKISRRRLQSEEEAQEGQGAQEEQDEEQEQQQQHVLDAAARVGGRWVSGGGSREAGLKRCHPPASI